MENKHIKNFLEKAKKLTSEKLDVDKVIADIIDTDWGESDDETGRIVQLLKGLAYSDDPKAKAFIKDLDAFTSNMDSDKYLK